MLYNLNYIGEENVQLSHNIEYRGTIGVGAAGYSVNIPGFSPMFYRSRRELFNNWITVGAFENSLEPVRVVPQLPQPGDFAIGDDTLVRSLRNELAKQTFKADYVVTERAAEYFEGYSDKMFPPVVFKKSDLIHDTETISKKELRDALSTAYDLGLSSQELYDRLHDQFLSDGND